MFMRSLIFLFFASTILFSCSPGIKKSRVCALENFDALKGCKSHTNEIVGFPETLVHSFRAKGFEENSMVSVRWYFEEKGKFFLIDSFTYYTKENDELVVSGIDRNFLQPGSYVVKVKVKDADQTYESEEYFSIQSNGETIALMLLVGNAIDPTGLVTRPHTYFTINDQRVFVSTYVYDAKPNQEILIRFRQIDVQGGYEKQFSTNVGPNPKNKFLLYANLPNVDLNLGEYQVEIVIGDVSFVAPFYIDETQITKPIL
jgi:hypothetical protein